MVTLSWKHLSPQLLGERVGWGSSVSASGVNKPGHSPTRRFQLPDSISGSHPRVTQGLWPGLQRSRVGRSSETRTRKLSARKRLPSRQNPLLTCTNVLSGGERQDAGGGAPFWAPVNGVLLVRGRTVQDGDEQIPEAPGHTHTQRTTDEVSGHGGRPGTAPGTSTRGYGFTARSQNPGPAGPGAHLGAQAAMWAGSTVSRCTLVTPYCHQLSSPNCLQPHSS